MNSGTVWGVSYPVMQPRGALKVMEWMPDPMPQQVQLTEYTPAHTDAGQSGDSTGRAGQSVRYSISA